MKNVLTFFIFALIGCENEIHKNYEHKYSQYSGEQFKLDKYCYQRAIRKSKSREYDPRSLAQALAYEKCMKDSNDE